jgi:hypothetical protein
MMFDVAEEARKEMLLSGFKKPIHSKPTDLGLWKKGQVHERGITFTIYKCHMSGRAGCRCMLLFVMAKDYLELQRSELRHHAASHAQDDSKMLKYEQIFAIRDAVVTAPQLSAAMHKMIPRSSSTNKYLQSGMRLSPRRSFLQQCLAETCRCTTVLPRQSSRAHVQLPASGLPCQQNVVCPTTQLLYLG